MTENKQEYNPYVNSNKSDFLSRKYASTKPIFELRVACRSNGQTYSYSIKKPNLDTSAIKKELHEALDNILSKVL